MAGLVLTCVMKDKDGRSRFPFRLTLLRPSLLPPPPLLLLSPWCCVLKRYTHRSSCGLRRGIRTANGEKWRLAEPERVSVGKGGMSKLTPSEALSSQPHLIVPAAYLRATTTRSSPWRDFAFHKATGLTFPNHACPHLAVTSGVLPSVPPFGARLQPIDSRRVVTQAGKKTNFLSGDEWGKTAQWERFQELL